MSSFIHKKIIHKGDINMAREFRCNMCGKEMNKFDIEEGFSFDKWLGYGSKYDGGYFQIDLCCECMDKLIDSCLISPIKEARI